ncbi:hypothetical protein [Deinococcus multiflagellatus]|uniref:DUF4139 domain-containing protein n=1 Tax=Deinococcus multiflagellatus TaxID=1656887 RepID=A0ABW1ZT86_9DEIO|nr:hypothetical protein [Deinococcus multiflagellatus]MBZ9716057.1 hypothetical protein [Deinococcus multiflagellatus]
MTRRLTALALLLTLGLPASATDLRLYPGFAEVRTPVTLQATGGQATHQLRFSRAAWSFIQPGSLTFTGAPLRRLEVRPTDLDWLTTQQGQPVRVLRAGQAPLDGVLVRAADLLVRLSSGEYLTAAPGELAFAALPPLDALAGGVAVQLEVAGEGQVTGALSYRTQALAWQPRYELNAAGSGARLAALAEIRNRGTETYEARQVDLFAGDVRTTPDSLGNEQQSGRGVTSAAAVMPLPQLPGSAGVTSLGEVRGLQRYALPGGLTLGRGESLTLPFVQPRLTGFTRYALISTYFDRQERTGRANRHYKFTPDQSLPTGPLTVREDGTLVGTVTLPAAQASRPVDLDLGADHELRYVRRVQTLGVEKNAEGRVLSTTFQVTYTLISTKARSVQAQVREQLYGRFVVVDGQPAPSQQVTVARRVDVPAGQQATVSFRVKLGAN